MNFLQHQGFHTKHFSLLPATFSDEVKATVVDQMFDHLPRIRLARVCSILLYIPYVKFTMGSKEARNPHRARFFTLLTLDLLRRAERFDSRRRKKNRIARKFGRNRSTYGRRLNAPRSTIIKVVTVLERISHLLGEVVF